MFAIATINASNEINTTAVIENTFGLFEISFGVLHFSASTFKNISRFILYFARLFVLLQPQE